MTDVRPFRALRYDPARASLSSVLAPVYDVVTPEERITYWDRDAHNAVRLELTREVGEEATTDYADTSARLAAWRAEGVLRRDETPALYALRQRFTAPDGRALARTGFFASLHLEDYARRIVRPHERTLSGPKADRLKLLRATRANLSAVFLLYEDRDAKLESWLEPALSAQPLRATDGAGVVNELALVADARAVGAIQQFLAERPVVIADGHHRYETALAYRDERRAAGERSEDAPPERILAYFANAFSEGTLLLPIHRVVVQGPLPGAERWERLRARGWERRRVQVAGAEHVQAALASELAPLAGRYAFAFDDTSGALQLWSRPAAAELSVRVIHSEVLGEVFGLGDEALRQGAVAFPKSALQAARDVRAGRGVAALYLNPLLPDDVFRVTAAGEVLPQKSTFFMPKLPTGLLFRTLEP